MKLEARQKVEDPEEQEEEGEEEEGKKAGRSHAGKSMHASVKEVSSNTHTHTHKTVQQS